MEREIGEEARGIYRERDVVKSSCGSRRVESIKHRHVLPSLLLHQIVPNTVGEPQVFKISCFILPKDCGSRVLCNMGL